jgi:hypothetical protein
LVAGEGVFPLTQAWESSISLFNYIHIFSLKRCTKVYRQVDKIKDFTMASSNILLEDIFHVKNIDEDGKKFVRGMEFRILVALINV